MSRFSDIRRGNRLKQALDAYQEYLARPISSALPTYKARPTPIALQITPFGFALPAGTLARVNGNASWTTINGTAGVAGLTTVALAGATAGELSGFSPARVIWFRNATKTVSTDTSKYTGQSYRKYAGDRLSMPFGQQAGTDREFVVGQAIKSALKAVAGFEVNRVSLTPERNRAD